MSRPWGLGNCCEVRDHGSYIKVYLPRSGRKILEKNPEFGTNIRDIPNSRTRIPLDACESVKFGIIRDYSGLTIRPGSIAKPMNHSLLTTFSGIRNNLYYLRDDSGLGISKIRDLSWFGIYGSGSKLIRDLLVRDLLIRDPS